MPWLYPRWSTCHQNIHTMILQEIQSSPCNQQLRSLENGWIQSLFLWILGFVTEKKLSTGVTWLCNCVFQSTLLCHISSRRLVSNRILTCVKKLQTQVTSDGRSDYIIKLPKFKLRTHRKWTWMQLMDDSYRFSNCFCPPDLVFGEQLNKICFQSWGNQHRWSLSEIQFLFLVRRTWYDIVPHLLRRLIQILKIKD